MQLKERTILLSQSSLCRAALAGLYHLALLILRAIFRLSGKSQAIIVRRPPWKDLYPGDSDFDLSIVLRNSPTPWIDLCSLQRLGLRAKRFFPMLGELWIVPQRRLSRHLQTLWFDYPFPRTAAPDVSWRLAQLLMLQLWPSLFRPRTLAERYFFRSARKFEWKWYHLFRVFHGKYYSPLHYPSFSSYELWIANPQNVASNIAKIFQRIVRDSATIHIPTNYSFTVSGKSCLEPQRDTFQKLADELVPILSKVRSVFTHIWLCHSRFSTGDYILIFELSDDERFFSNPQCMDFLTQLSPLLQRHKAILHPAQCTFLTPTLLTFLRSADPIFGALFQKERFDVLGKNFHFQEVITQNCSLSALACELSNHEILISSLARFKSNEYAEELFSRQLPCLSDIIRCGHISMNEHFPLLRQQHETKLQPVPLDIRRWTTAHDNALRSIDELWSELDLRQLHCENCASRPSQKSERLWGNATHT